MDYNINEANDGDKIYTNEPEKTKKDNNEDFDEQYDILFNDNIDINSLSNQKINTMKSSDLNLEKELLTQSKRSINISKEDDYLISRKWDYLDDGKIKIINDKIDKIFKEMNKSQYKTLNQKIEQCDLSVFYENYNSRYKPSRIGTFSSLNYLIENTYDSQPTHVQLMFSDKSKLEKYLYKYRTILGDGDCFYRGIIFSFLENIILTRNVMQLKEITILFDEKINAKNPLVKEKEYLNRIKDMNISIVTQILYTLILTLEEDVKKAYIILIKVFLYAKDFDEGMIYFTRYLLFEYISSNENKIFSRENKINVGCFLPEIFITDKGETDDFQFESYYSMQLMKPKQFAEKIVIYIAPFIFNCDINVLIYDFGTNSCIQEKLFTREKKSEYTINLLFRKAHYDIYYKKAFCDKYSDKLEILNNIYENILYLNAKNPEEVLGKSFNNLNNQNTDNYELVLSGPDSNNDGGTPKCLECKKSFTQKENVFGLCNDCLLNILNTHILNCYFVYLQQNGNTRNSEEKLQSFFRNQKCTISVHHNISLMNAIFNSGYKFEDLFLNIRKTICLFCGINIQENNYFIELPCKCRICKKECFDDYFTRISRSICTKEENIIDVGLNSLSCPCGHKYNINSYAYMMEEMEKRKLKEYSEKYLEFIKLNWKWKCMMCGRNFMRNDKFFRLVFNDDNIRNLIKKKFDLRHLICHSCACMNQIDKKKTIKCQFCKSEHKIKDFLNVDENNNTESDCIII